VKLDQDEDDDGGSEFEISDEEEDDDVVSIFISCNVHINALRETNDKRRNVVMNLANLVISHYLNFNCKGHN
jgi:hypothetical protein